MQPVRLSAGARRILPRRLKLALQPFGVLKAKKGRSRATFQLWSKFRRHSNRPESNSSTMTSWAASAFGWQRRKESDDVKPLVTTKIFARYPRMPEAAGAARLGASAEVHWLRGHPPHSRRNGNLTSRSHPRSTPLFARTTGPRNLDHDRCRHGWRGHPCPSSYAVHRISQLCGALDYAEFSRLSRSMTPSLIGSDGIAVAVPAFAE